MVAKNTVTGLYFTSSSFNRGFKVRRHEAEHLSVADVYNLKLLYENVEAEEVVSADSDGRFELLRNADLRAEMNDILAAYLTGRPALTDKRIAKAVADRRSAAMANWGKLTGIAYSVAVQVFQSALAFNGKRHELTLAKMLVSLPEFRNFPEDYMRGKLIEEAKEFDKMTE